MFSWYAIRWRLSSVRNGQEDIFLILWIFATWCKKGSCARICIFRNIRNEINTRLVNAMIGCDRLTELWITLKLVVQSRALFPRPRSSASAEQPHFSGTLLDDA